MITRRRLRFLTSAAAALVIALAVWTAASGSGVAFSNASAAGITQANSGSAGGAYARMAANSREAKEQPPDSGKKKKKCGWWCKVKKAVKAVADLWDLICKMPWVRTTRMCT